ncbi:MAG: radical SAM protein [Treponema sp.]|jgi:oxygen-independent coproporphyrinogen-3 oxidase|nr:radical SAM protein [Treponema sp.]
MFTERYRSHHDAERALSAALNVTKRSDTVDWAEVEKTLRKSPPGGKRGIYIHVPHCDRICTFCNLNRTERQGADLEAYAAYIIAEIKSYGAYPYVREQPFDAVYFGGGTPTVFSTDQFSRILEALRRHIPLTADSEISVESTQHNLGVKKAAALEARGVNRFSIGIQTFSGRGRELLGRTFNEERAREELLALRSAFTGALGIDIIYSYPGQSLEEINRDAEICVSSNIDSVSFYSLMIHRGSALGRSIEEGTLQFVRNVEWDRERHHAFYNKLTESGFTLLELSKLARPGRDAYRYIHIRYENGDLIPIGSGAGGSIAGYPVYSAAPGRRFVSPGNERYDRYYRMLGELQFGRYDPAKLTAGLGPEAEQAVTEKIGELSGRGFLNALPDSPVRVLSPDGVFWGNNIAVEVLRTAIDAAKKEEPIYA